MTDIPIKIEVWTEEKEEQKILKCIKSRCVGLAEEDPNLQPIVATVIKNKK